MSLSDTHPRQPGAVSQTAPALLPVKLGWRLFEIHHMKKPKPTSPQLSECWTIPKAAEHLGIPRSTLASAIKAGKLQTYQSGCGREMVRLADCKPWVRE